MRTETSRLIRRAKERLIRASMEPSSDEDGDQKSRSGRSPEALLQWSRPQMRTETTSATHAQARSSPELQWSRPQMRTETEFFAAASKSVLLLQWSRPQMRTETARLLSRCQR